MVKKQTAGRKQLGDFAPKFAELNDDVLFGQVWAREDKLSAHERSVITITALIAGGNFEQLKYHLQVGKDNGISKEEISEIITHLSFYVGWPSIWPRKSGLSMKDVSFFVKNEKFYLHENFIFVMLIIGPKKG